MRGSYRDEKLRARKKREYRETNVPRFTKREVDPIVPFLPETGPIRALDVGANKGIWSKAMLNTFGTRIERIDLFDPSPENCRELRDRDDSLLFDPADFPAMHVHECAVGREAGRATLHTNDDGSPLASLYDHAEGGFPPNIAHVKLDRKIEVDLRALDDVMDAEGVDGADILKIDTEGHEMQVMLGAARRLERKAIGAMVFEFGSHHVESRTFFKDFYVLLRDLGYTLLEPGKTGFVPIQRYEYRFENFSRNFVYMAVAK